MADNTQKDPVFRHTGAYPGEAVIQQKEQTVRLPFGALQLFVRQTELEISSRLDAVNRMPDIYGSDWTIGVPQQGGWYACLLSPAWTLFNPDPKPEVVMCEVIPSSLAINFGEMVVHFLPRIGAQPLHRLQSSYFMRISKPEIDLEKMESAEPELNA